MDDDDASLTREQNPDYQLEKHALKMYAWEISWLAAAVSKKKKSRLFDSRQEAGSCLVVLSTDVSVSLEQLPLAHSPTLLFRLVIGNVNFEASNQNQWKDLRQFFFFANDQLVNEMLTDAPAHSHNHTHVCVKRAAKLA